jgi:hypothetical protein
MTADELRREIEQTRQHLGETVDELASKADMKAKARAKATEAKVRVQVMWRHWPEGVAASGLVVAAAAIWQRRKQA